MYAVPRGTLKAVPVSAKDDETRPNRLVLVDCASPSCLGDSSEFPPILLLNGSLNLYGRGCCCQTERVGKKEVAIIVWSYPMVPIGEKLLNVEPRQFRRFIMGSKTRRSTLVRFVVPIALLAVIALGAGYYSASAAKSFPVAWSVNPLMIKFNASGSFSGSAPDSFTCSPSVSPVTLQASSSQPDIISITVSPASFSSCGSTPDNIVVTASCTPAHQDSSCEGDQYTGQILVCGPSSYTCLKQSLVVNVAVTTNPH